MPKENAIVTLSQDRVFLSERSQFIISFDKSDFHHLAGLHKLKDNAKVQYGKRADIFDSILTEKITLEQIQKSEFYTEIIYLFLGARTHDKGEQMCRTFFPKQELDYAQGQEKYTLLKKEKINIETGMVEVQYNRFQESEENLNKSTEQQ